MRHDDDIRPGEIAVTPPPATDAGLVFIGRIHTPWTGARRDPPAGQPRRPAVPHRGVRALGAGAAGLERHERIEVVYWLHLARRDLVAAPRQRRLHPRHLFHPLAGAAQPDRHRDRRLVSIEGNVVFVRGLDCLDGTPLLDLKPDRRPAAP